MSPTEKVTHSQRSCILLKATGRSEPSTRNSALLMLNLFDWQFDRLCISSDSMSVSHRLKQEIQFCPSVTQKRTIGSLTRKGNSRRKPESRSEETRLAYFPDTRSAIALANGFRNIVGVPEHILTFCFDKIHCIL